MNPVRLIYEKCGWNGPVWNSSFNFFQFLDKFFFLRFPCNLMQLPRDFEDEELHFSRSLADTKPKRVRSSVDNVTPGAVVRNGGNGMNGKVERGTCQFESYDPTRKLFCLYSWWTTSLIKTRGWAFHRLWILEILWYQYWNMYSYKVAKPCTSLDQYQKCSHREIPCVVWTLWVPYPLGNVNPSLKSSVHVDHGLRWKITIDGKFQSMCNCHFSHETNKSIENESFSQRMISFDIISPGSSFRRYPHLISALSGSRTPTKPSGKKDGKQTSPNYLGSWNHTQTIHAWYISLHFP